MQDSLKDNVYKSSELYNSNVIKPDAVFSPNFETIGFQSTNLHIAETYLSEIKAKHIPLMLGFTSNVITSGLREYISLICKQFNVVGIVTTAGAIEEDFMKSFSPFKLMNTEFTDQKHRNLGLNRSGNIIVENESYTLLEAKLKLIFGNSINLSPKEICKQLGKYSSDLNSVLKTCYLRNIPVYCYSILDGAFGDFVYFSTNSGNINVYEDHKDFLDSVISLKQYAILMLGGSTPKHALMNAGLIRGGTDYVIHLTTEQDFDGSNAGANPSEGISWGKIKSNSKSIKVICDFTISLPIILNKVFNK